MTVVVPLKKYLKADDVQHVMYDKQDIQQLHNCPACGDLQVIDGVVWHVKPIEDHDAG